ncbi:hypothetical protein [Endozoicomonas sp.]|uniref:hypothetical protein n=1 Tax=Endozoicomonas sp. TaxID=1892382 RepID=UPI003AF9F6F7
MVRILAIGWLCFLIGLSVSKSLGYGHWLWGSVEHFLGGNLEMHFLMAFVLSFLGHWAFNGIARRGVLLAFLIIGCALDEGLQFFLPLRAFNPVDFMVTCLGLILAAAPFIAMEWRVFFKT